MNGRGGVGLVPIGLAVTWLGYTVGVWGYCLVRGYDVTFMQCFKPQWPGGTSKQGSSSSSAGSSGSGSTGTPTFTRPGSPTGQGQNSVGSRL